MGARLGQMRSEPKKRTIENMRQPGGRRVCMCVLEKKKRKWLQQVVRPEDGGLRFLIFST